MVVAPSSKCWCSSAGRGRRLGGGSARCRTARRRGVQLLREPVRDAPDHLCQRGRSGVQGPPEEKRASKASASFKLFPAAQHGGGPTRRAGTCSRTGRRTLVHASQDSPNAEEAVEGACGGRRRCSRACKQERTGGFWRTEQCPGSDECFRRGGNVHCGCTTEARAGRSVSAAVNHRDSVERDSAHAGAWTDHTRHPAASACRVASAGRTCRPQCIQPDDRHPQLPAAHA